MAAEEVARGHDLSAGDIAILGDNLGYADALAPGLGERLLRFVLTGEDGGLFDVLAEFETATLFGALWPTNYRHDEKTPEHRRQVASRLRLYTMERLDPAVMIRFGYLLAMGRGSLLGSYNTPGVDTTPAWLPALLMLDEAYAPDAGHRLLTAPRCRDLLAADGRSIGPLVECLFVGNNARYNRHHEWAFAIPDLAETLAGDPPAVLEVMRDLDTEAQIALIGFVGASVLSSVPAILDAAFGWVALKKGIGQAALAALARAPHAALMERIERHLASRAAAERMIGVRVLAACLPDPLTRLDAHAKSETSKVVLQAIEEARALLVPTGAASAEDVPLHGARIDGPQGYWAADGSYVEAPPSEEPPPSCLRPDAPDALAAIVGEIAAAASAEHEIQRKQPWPEPKPHEVPDGDTFWAKINARNEAARLARIAELSAPYVPPLHPGDVRPFIDVMTGTAPPAAGRSVYNGYYGLVGGAHLNKTHAFARKRLRTFLARDDVDWRHLTRLMLINNGKEGYAWSNFLFGICKGQQTSYDPIEAELYRRVAAGADVRAIVALLGENGIDEPELVARMMTTGSDMACGDAPGSASLWPLLNRDLDKLDDRWTAAAAPHAEYRDKTAFVLLGAFPKLPRRALKLVLDAALGSDKPLRALARTLARRAGDLTDLLTPMIDASDAPRRLAAVRWLGELGDASAKPALRKALGGKRTIVDRAAIIGALAACGDNISDLFAADTLLDEARAGLAKTKSDFSALFDPEALPVLHWADGGAVAPDLVRWWFTMAHKLKQPGGDALLHMALDRLAPADAARLGDAVLSAFVAYDTRQPDAAEAEAFAKAELPARMKARSWDKTFTAEQALADLRAESLGSYTHSAHEHRGLLALARHASGPVAAAHARHMLVKHWRRTPQGKSMLDYLASNPAPAALQVLIGVSQRHKTAAVQAYAAAIADRLAD